MCIRDRTNISVTPGTSGVNWTIDLPNATVTFLKEGSYTVNATDERGLWDTATINVSKVLRNFSVNITPSTIYVNVSTTVLVNVTDADTKEPVLNATVNLSGCGVELSNKTNASGIAIFEVNATSTGNITVTVSKTGYNTWMKEDGIVVAPMEIHDVYIDTEYEGTYGTGIRIENRTGAIIPPEQNLTVGEIYYIKFKVVNNGTVKPERVNITVEISNETWGKVLDAYEKEINDYHIGDVTWDTSGLAPGNYTITVNASIPEDAHPEDNKAWRDVVIVSVLPRIGDMNGDGEVNFDDVIALAKHIYFGDPIYP